MNVSEYDDSWDDTPMLRGAILDEPVAALEPTTPVCVPPGTSYRDAIEAMNKVKLGCVFITEGEQVLGILTERDILRHVVGKLDLDGRVDTSMTPNPESVRLHDGIAYALNKMATGGYRNIPVVDDAGKLVGLVTVRHFVRFIVSLFPAAVLNLPPDAQLIAATPEGA